MSSTDEKVKKMSIAEFLQMNANDDEGSENYEAFKEMFKVGYLAGIAYARSKVYDPADMEKTLKAKDEMWGLMMTDTQNLSHNEAMAVHTKSMAKILGLSEE